NVPLAVADVEAVFGVLEKCRRMPHVFQPAIAFLPLDRHPRWIDLPFQRIAPFELLACPELDCGQSQGQTFGRYRQAGMHQDAADGVMQRASLLVLAHVRFVEDADRSYVIGSARSLRQAGLDGGPKRRQQPLNPRKPRLAKKGFSAAAARE